MVHPIPAYRLKIKLCKPVVKSSKNCPLRSGSYPPFQHSAAKPTSSSCHRKHRRGAASSRQTIEEEASMSTAAAAAAAFPTPSSATALSPRLAVDAVFFHILLLS
ncbi:hypothetical protein ATANTOWER_011192 [Ataeniobius toweri]|uniref:Uncharacterized protein n=1 Tax=Ataeniobius toweri TaxID=208326 RepID=A0ABU7AFC5_9TELE|nr:hypothetical protein [Ataeniobius toweri]